MRVAVVGATGAVGSTMLGVMRERTFPADEIVPFASERSEGRRIDFGDRELTVLGQAGVNIEMISTSPIKISCVVREQDVRTAVEQLHTAFGLGADAVLPEDVAGDHRPRINPDDTANAA